MQSTSRIAVVAALVSAVLLCGLVGRAAAAESIESFSSSLSTTLAGGHPDITTSFTLAEPGVEEAARNITFETPVGLFGNPRAISRCNSIDFALSQCPSASQAGLITLRANYNGNSNFLLGTAPIYNLDPGEIKPAVFGFIVPTIDLPIQVPVSVRTTSDYGLRFTVANITQMIPPAQIDMTFWGFPAYFVHDAQRFPKGAPGEPAGCPAEAGTGCLTEETDASITEHPLIDNPTICTGEPQPVRLKVETYQDPDHTSQAETTYPAVSECERETFQPALFAAPTSKETDSASGLDITITNLQSLNVAATASQLKTSVITFPEGLTINPDAADGQLDCKDSQALFDSEGPSACPDSGKIGTVTLHSAALEGNMSGSIYIGQPHPGDQYRLYIMASGFGINVKLVGTFHPDPTTGQVTATFADLPQALFDEFDIHLFASERGLVATPTACRIYETSAVFYPWNSALPPVQSSEIFGLNSGPHGAECPGQVRPFAPRLAAGTSSAAAGAHTTFGLQLDRDDGDQFLGDLNFTFPPGLTGSLRGLTYCPESGISKAAERPGRAEQDSPSCPDSSLIGSTNVAAGPGSHPFHVEGRMYLAGPFKGMPLSVVAITPALAGPYDYGTQVVRVGIDIDKLDAHVSAVSDTVPQIIGGIPLRLRSIRVSIDKSDLLINPTNCDPMSVKSQGIGDEGTITSFSSYFRAVNCEQLSFRPKMRIRQVGGRTRRSANPWLQFDLFTNDEDANIKSLSVTLPSAFAIDQRHLGNICSEKELASSNCAGRTPIGKATTTTPLLDQPLSGPVYAVSGSGGLPKLAFLLNGQVNLLPRAETKTIAKGGAGELQTTVPVVPDAPIGHFHLIVFGGKTGYLINTRNLCGHSPVVKVEYTGQNGKKRTQNVGVKTPCKGGKKRAARHGQHAR